MDVTVYMLVPLEVGSGGNARAFGVEGGKWMFFRIFTPYITSVLAQR